jgi:hypothetical protein
LRVEATEPQLAMIAATRFRLSELAVDGFMVVAIGATSFSRISNALVERMG